MTHQFKGVKDKAACEAECTAHANCKYIEVNGCLKGEACHGNCYHFYSVNNDVHNGNCTTNGDQKAYQKPGYKYLFNGCPRGGGMTHQFKGVKNKAACEAECTADANCKYIEVNGCLNGGGCQGNCYYFYSANTDVHNGKCVTSGDQQAYLKPDTQAIDGKWTMTYTNGFKQTYEIHANEIKGAEGTTGQLLRTTDSRCPSTNHHCWKVTGAFTDPQKTEFMIKRNGKLEVKHYNPNFCCDGTGTPVSQSGQSGQSGQTGQTGHSGKTDCVSTQRRSMKVYFLWDSADKAEWDIVKAELKAPQGPDDFGETSKANDGPWYQVKDGKLFVRAQGLLLYDAKGQKLDALLGSAETDYRCRGSGQQHLHFTSARKKFFNLQYTEPDRYGTNCWEDALQIFSGNEHTFAWEGSVLVGGSPVTIKAYDLNAKLIDQANFTPPA